MRNISRTRLMTSMTFIAAAATVALAAAPASAAPFTKINISRTAIPSSASCLSIQNSTAGWQRGNITFTRGSELSVTGVSIAAFDGMTFTWTDSISGGCGSRVFRTDNRTAPNSASDVWNIR